jgi:SlyX protein
MSDARMNDFAGEIDARIDELETRVAFQEDTLAQLNDLVAEQDARIRALVERFQDMAGKYQDLTYEMQKGANPADEKPPHY